MTGKNGGVEGLYRGKAEFVALEGGGEGGKRLTAGGNGLEEVFHKSPVCAGVEGEAGKVGEVLVNDAGDCDVAAIGLKGGFGAADDGGVAFQH